MIHYSFNNSGFLLSFIILNINIFKTFSFRFHDYYFTSIFGWKCLLDIVDLEGNRLFSTIGFRGESREELLFFDVLGNIKLDESHWPPMRWHHLCVAVNKRRGIVKLVNELEITTEFSMEDSKLTNSTNLIDAVSIMKRALTVQTKASEEEMGVEKILGSMVGSISDMNLWNRSLGVEDMMSWVNCTSLLKGNIINWDTSEWILENITITDIPLHYLCKKEKNQIFPAMKALRLTSNIFCDKIGGNIFSSLISSKIKEILEYKSENCEICKAKLVGTPFQYDKYEGYFVNQITGKKVLIKNWAKSNPNYGINCVGLNRFGEFESISCNTYVCPVCQFDQSQQIKLRGVCESIDDIDNAYIIDIKHHDDYTSVFRGNYRTHIIYMEESHSWIIYDIVEEKVLAMQNDSFIPIGKQKWVFTSKKCNEPGYEWKFLTFSVCEENEFICDDGQCIMDYMRCDNFLNCNDGTDEEDCTIVDIPGSYAKDVPPRSNLTIGVMIQDIIDISKSHIDIRFEIIFSWVDDRLKFRNIKNESYMNLIPEDEASCLWTPKLYFPQLIENIQSHHSSLLYITKSSEKFEKYKDNFITVKLYDGSEHPLTYKRQHTKSFACDQGLQWYPFDTQICIIELRLDGLAQYFMG